MDWQLAFWLMTGAMLLAMLAWCCLWCGYRQAERENLRLANEKDDALSRNAYLESQVRAADRVAAAKDKDGQW